MSEASIVGLDVRSDEAWAIPIARQVDGFRHLELVEPFSSEFSAKSGLLPSPERCTRVHSEGIDTVIAGAHLRGDRKAACMIRGPNGSRQAVGSVIGQRHGVFVIV